RSWPLLAFFDRLCRMHGLLCRESKAQGSGAACYYLWCAVRRSGLSVYVPGRATAHVSPELRSPTFSSGNRFGNSYALRRVAHFARRSLVFEITKLTTKQEAMISSRITKRGTVASILATVVFLSLRPGSSTAILQTGSGLQGASNPQSTSSPAVLVELFTSEGC